jgi:serine/threonine protein kinase
MAPEQIEGRGIGPATDVYALACMAYTMLVGEAPYKRDSRSATLLAHLNAAAPLPSGTRPELPPEVDDLVRRGLAKNAAERPSSAGELIRETRTRLAQSGALITDESPTEPPLTAMSPEPERSPGKQVSRRNGESGGTKGESDAGGAAPRQ